MKKPFGKPDGSAQAYMNRKISGWNGATGGNIASGMLQSCLCGI